MWKRRSIVISESKENLEKYTEKVIKESPNIHLLMHILMWASIPASVFVGVGLAILIAGYFQNITAYIIAAIFAIAGLFGGIPFWDWATNKYYYFPKARLIIRDANSFESKAREIAISLAGEPCYYISMSEKFGGAIAANPRNSQVAICMGEYKYGEGHNFSKILLDSEEILSARVAEGEQYTYSTNSQKVSDKMEAARLSHLSRRDYIKNTGILIHTKNLEFPKIFLNTDKNSAESWILIIQKIKEQKLDKLTESKRYPFNS